MGKNESRKTKAAALTREGPGQVSAGGGGAALAGAGMDIILEPFTVTAPNTGRLPWGSTGETTNHGRPGFAGDTAAVLAGADFLLSVFLNSSIDKCVA